MIHGALRDGRRRAANAPSTRFSFLCSRPTGWPSRAFTTSPAQGAVASACGNINPIRNTSTPKKHKSKQEQTPKQTPRQTHTPKVTPKQPVNEPDAHQCLELCLPPHLRIASESTLEDTPFVPNAPATAKLALEAFSGGNGFLTHLAIDQGRWRAAVWIVKLLLEHFHMQPTHSDRLYHTVQEWTRTGTLDEMTENRHYLVPDPGELQTSHIKTSSSASLDELTGHVPGTLRRLETLRHQILGLIWRDIGRLIMACSSHNDIAGGEVKPEVLEMIALLHHHELMPASIYAYVPAENEDAIQQPPTLHLLSSRIFTALSDATWRARELTAAEEAKKQGGLFMGLEAKGSSYRVRVSGIKPEIWLELILWSCLHGGWIEEGASLLGSIHRSKSRKHGQWKPISWRDSLNAIMPFGRGDLLDWDSIKYNFDTRSSATMDGVDITGLRVDKTVSSEVVNAYIDALLTTVNAGVGIRGLDLTIVMSRIRELRRFLQRANLNLGGGSWDAIMLRLVESGGIDIDREPAVVQHLVALSPPIGEELQSRRSQAIPAYVLDGSAAVLGLLHRALYTEIRNSNLEGALKVFQVLQGRVDNDRHQSLRDFFAHKHLSSAESDDSAKGLFTSNFAGIDYPSFATQIPPATLAAFLELVIANKSFDLGNWMLGINNTDIDGPLIPESLYRDPHISAAIVYYATATDNTALLSKITELGAAQAEDGTPNPANELLQALFNTQVELRRWDAAEKVVAYMRDKEGFDWSVENAATVAKAMVVGRQNAMTVDDTGSEFIRADKLFASLLTGEYGVVRRLSGKKEAINTLCVVLSAVSPLLATSVRNINALPRFFTYSLRAAHFNIVLEGVVTTLGSAAGQALVDRFPITRRPMQHAADDGETSLGRLLAGEEASVEDSDTAHDQIPIMPPRRRMPRSRQDALKADRLPRTSISILCARAPPANVTTPTNNAARVYRLPGNRLPKSWDSTVAPSYEQNVAMYGTFRPSPTTVRIVVRQALLERAKTTPQQHAESDPKPTSSLDIFAWALFTLRRAGLGQAAVQRELDFMASGMTNDEVRSVEERADEMWKEVFVREEGREPDAFD